MEPIRSDRSRQSRRRSTRSGGGTAADGGFARSLSGAAEGATADDVSAADEATNGGPVLESATIPGGVDAPTERLFDAVHAAGQRLLDRRTYSAAQAYRQAVQQFLRKVLPEANAVQISESGYGILSRKRYYVLTEINRSVDRLLRGLQQSQTEQLDILRRLEEIQGLLIDLIH